MLIPDATRTLPRSGIREIMDLALARPGTIRLELGEPDFPTAPNIVEAAHRAAATGLTKYTATTGIPALREALASKIALRNGFDVARENVLVSSGAVQGLYASLVGLVDPGAGILVPSPGWPNYQMMCRLLRARAQSYPLRASNGFVPSIADLEELVDESTRVIVLNSPSNPVGSVLDEARMRDILEFAARHRLWVVSDECYDELTFDAPHVSAARLDADDRVISVFSFSKTYAMTGWRIGYLALPAAAASALANVHEAMLSCVAMPTQYAALEAVTGPQGMVAEMRDAYRDRRDAALASLADAGIPAFRPSGAFYVWIDVSASGLTGDVFARRLVAEHEVALAPGPAFGPEGRDFVRMSTAADRELVLEGAARLSELVHRCAEGSTAGTPSTASV